MNAEIAKLWVAKLREPGLVQSKHLLNDGRGMCCLGVLCNVHNKVVGETDWEEPDEDRDYVRYLGAYELLPGSVKSWAGMRSLDGTVVGDKSPLLVGGEAYGDLASANDDGRTFAEIADAIEANVERL